MRKVGVIGAGVVGTAVGYLLSQKEYEVTAVFDVKPESTELFCERTGARKASNPVEVSRSSDYLFITTNDSAINEVAEQVARQDGFREGQLVAHMSGALTSDALAPAAEQGALVASIHPMQSFAGVDHAIANLSGSVFSIEGDERAVPLASEIVKDLGGESFCIDKKAKPLYHAGACVVSNYLVTLIDLGLQLLESTGIPRQKALRAFMPLVNGTIKNIEKMGIPRALTGPIARGDLVTVLKHLDSLTEMAPELTSIYSLLGYYTLRVAKDKGTIDEDVTENFKRVFMREMLGKSAVRSGGDSA